MDVQQEQEGEAMQDVRLRPGPAEPTMKMREEHEASGHVVFRSWCRICLAASGVGEQHRASTQDEEGTLPVLAMDYFYMNDGPQPAGSTPEPTLPFIVIKDSKIQAFSCTALEAKGVNKYAVDFLIGFVKDLAWKRLIFQSDNEPALVALQDKATALLPGVEVIPRRSIEGDSRGNGAAENAVKEMKNRIRAIKQATEEKLGVRLTKSQPMLSWIARHAATCINRYKLGKDGLTPEIRRTGRRWRKPGLLFGERLMVRPLKLTTKKQDNVPRMICGHYVGHHHRTGAALVMTAGGTIRGRGVSRLPESERWSPVDVATMRGLPWHMGGKPLDKDTMGTSETAPGPISRPEVPVKRQRRRYVLKSDIHRFGGTEGCQACPALTLHGTGKAGLPHTDACRDRIGILLEEEVDGAIRMEEYRSRTTAEVAGETTASREADVDVEINADEAVGAPVEPTPSPGAASSSLPPVPQPASSSSTAAAEPEDDREVSQAKRV